LFYVCIFLFKVKEPLWRVKYYQFFYKKVNYQHYVFYMNEEKKTNSLTITSLFMRIPQSIIDNYEYYLRFNS